MAITSFIEKAESFPETLYLHPLFLSPSHHILVKYLKIIYSTLGGVAQWIERWCVTRKVGSLIPSQGTCLGCRPGPQ